MQGLTKQEDKNKYYASSAILSYFFPTDELSHIIPKQKLLDDDFVKTTYLCVYFRTRKFNKNDQKNSFKSIVRIYRLFDKKRDKDKEKSEIEFRKHMTIYG